MCAVDAIHMIYALPIECSRSVAVYQWADKGVHTNDEKENEREKKMNLVFIMANLSLQSIVTVTSKRNETKRRDTIFYVFMRWLLSSLAFTLTHQKVCWKASSFANARSPYRTFKILMHTRMQITKLIYLQEKCNHYFVSVCISRRMNFSLVGWDFIWLFLSFSDDAPFFSRFVQFACCLFLFCCFAHVFAHFQVKQQQQSEEKKYNTHKKMWKCMVKVRI